MDATVTQAPGADRWEISVAGRVAGYLTYRKEPGRVALEHTVVDPAYEGQGLASQLVRASLDRAREQGLDVLPVCSYVRSWIGRHPDYLDLVPAGERAGYGL